MTAKSSDNASFGFRDVPPEEKPGLVRGVFSSVADRYDLMNDLMSGGVHRLWKASLIDQLRPRPNQHLLDVAGGTGDIAFRFLAAGGGRVTVCDLTESMVRVGRDRALDRGLLASLDWTVGDAQALPVADGSVDAQTIAFGLRNVTDIDSALREAHRVLRPGGRFLCLEFSHVALPLLDRLYDTCSFTVLPSLGRWVRRTRTAIAILPSRSAGSRARKCCAKRCARRGWSVSAIETSLAGSPRSIRAGEFSLC